MKNIAFTLSLLTILSTSILYPMEHSTNLNRQADSQDLVYTCPSQTCNKTFALKSDLNAHVQQMHTLNGMTMLSGFESEKGYQTNNHMDVEASSYPYSNTMMPYCMMQYPAYPASKYPMYPMAQYPQAKKIPVQTITNKICNMAQCNFEGCNQMCPSRSALIAHYRKHTQERPFKCTVCNQSFTQKGLLKTHEKTKKHKDNKALLDANHSANSTPIYDASFTQNDLTECKPEEEYNANNHMAIEASSYPYFNTMMHSPDSTTEEEEEYNFKAVNDNIKLFEVGESGSEKENNTPKALGTEEYSSKSEDDITELFEAGEKTSEEENESMHLRVRKVATQAAANKIRKRVPSKNFPCTFKGCSKSFAWQNSLTRHIKAKHSNKLLECKACKKSFSNKSKLTRHIQTQHSPTREL